MIEFKDVTGEVTKRPGESFFKMDSISDEAIEEYKSRGAVIVKMDIVTHAHALKLKTASDLFKAQEALGSLRAPAEMEDLTLTAVRNNRQKAVDNAQAKDKVAEAKLVEAKAEKAEKAKARRDAKPHKTKGKK